MRNDEEEYWIQSIRAGTVNHQDITIVPATIEQMRDAADAYRLSYDESVDNGIMTDEGLESWMIENSLLPKSFYVSRENLNSSIDDIKKNLFYNRSSKSAVKKIRGDLKNARAKLKDLLAPKSQMSQNTCEFIAQTEKLICLLRQTTFKKGKLYAPHNINEIIEIWQNSLASESAIRALARSDCWRVVWTNKGFGFDLFQRRKNCDLTINQRNLITWSRMYDNIQESLDCPSDSVIEDDDMLDGWFLIQKVKREKERMEQEAEELSTKKDKMAEAGHVFIPQGSDNIDIGLLNEGNQSAAQIHDIVNSQRIKNEKL